MNRLIIYIALFVLSANYCLAQSVQNTEFTFVDNETENSPQSYQYTLVQAGDNYNFKFETAPTETIVKLRAGYHVLQTIYKDSSINKTYSEHYIRERARCYVFDSSLHTYSLCFLPNDFSVKNKDRFWGFVTQVPNWKWLVTRFFLPVLLVYGLVFYISRRRKAQA
ncbi:MAG: hypothetical protein DRQ62_01455 [Gammaproteobacteria bacterium]|nr:MAG: hypothetical protein DRQ62_01455 [Gammaproteobacteria bacterium]